MDSSTASLPEATSITVVIPAYNREDTIGSAVRSALAQSDHRVAAVIVVDDRSTDNTVEAAREAGAEVLSNERNSGAAVSRNRGLALVETDWVAFLDSDDAWRPGLLDNLMPKTPDHVLVAGTAVIWSQGAPVTVVGTTKPDGRQLSSPLDILVPENQIVISAAIVRTDAARSIGGFREDLRFSEDFDFWLRLLEQGPGWCDTALVTNYFRHTGGKSHGHVGPEQVRAEIVASFRDRPWFDARVHERFLGTIHWQSFRAAVWNRQRRRAARQLVASTLPPSRGIGLARVLLEHRRLRARLQRELPPSDGTTQRLETDREAVGP